MGDLILAFQGQEIQERLNGLAWTDAAVHELRYGRAMPALRRFYDGALPKALTRLARPWGGAVERAPFLTRSPWLQAIRDKSAWRIEGAPGFRTRARYSKAEAMAVIERHSKAVVLDLPVFRPPDALRAHITEHGLPLFGDRVDRP